MHSALVSAQLIIFRVPRSRLRGIYFEWRGILQLSQNLFFGSKMGGRLIHGIDLYTGKYGNANDIIYL